MKNIFNRSEIDRLNDVKFNYILFILIFIFLVLRILIFFSSPNLCSNQFHEQFVGVIGKELIEGHKLPLLEYKNNYAEGPSLVHGIIVSFLFLLFGKNYIALKLFPLLFNLGVLLILWTVIKEFYGKRAAILFGFLYVFSPPVFTLRSLVLSDIHFESLFFIFLILFLFLNLFRKSYILDNKNVHFGLTGIICGLSIYFDYLNMLMILVCFFSLFILNSRIFLTKEFCILILMMLLGGSILVADLLYYKNIFDTESFSVFHMLPLNIAFYKLKKLLFDYLPDSLSFSKIFIFDGKTLSYLYYSIFIAGFIKMVISYFKNLINNKNMLVLIIIAYSLFYIVIFSLFAMPDVPDVNREYEKQPYVYYKWILLLYPFIFIVVSIFIDNVAKWHRHIGYFIFFAMVFISLISNFMLISFANINKKKCTILCRPYSYFFMGYSFSVKYSKDIPKAIKLMNKFKGSEKTECLIGFASSVKQSDFRNCLAILSFSDGKDFARGLGSRVLTMLLDGMSETSAFHRIILDTIPAEYRPYYFTALGAYFSEITEDSYNDSWDVFLNFIESNIESFDRHYCYEGLKESYYRHLSIN